MRDLTTHELDAQLAEELPARELMQPMATAVAAGAVAVNVAVVTQLNLNVNTGIEGSVSQTNTSSIWQSATAHNSAPVTAAAVAAH